MKINWFKTMYYGENKEFKRNFWIAFKCFYDNIKDKITGNGYYSYKDNWHQFYWWNRKKAYKEYIKNFEGRDMSVGFDGWTIDSEKFKIDPQTFKKVKK